MRRRPTLVALALLAALGLLGCAAGSAEEGSSSTSTTVAGEGAAKLSLLFAVSGTTTVGEGRLAVAVDDEVTFISDRPDRVAGRLDGPTFIRLWNADGFAADPPNAVVSTARGSWSVELLTAAWDGGTGTLSFGYRPLDGPPPAEGALGRADLFIDDLPMGCGLDSPPRYPAIISFGYTAPSTWVDRAPVPTCQEVLAAFAPLFGAWIPYVPFTQLQGLLGASWTCSGGPEVTLIDGVPVPLPGAWICEGPVGAMVMMVGGPPQSPPPTPPPEVVAGNSSQIATGEPQE